MEPRAGLQVVDGEHLYFLKRKRRECTWLVAHSRRGMSDLKFGRGIRQVGCYLKPGKAEGFKEVDAMVIGAV